MKIKTFNFAGVIFNAHQIVTIQKVTLENGTKEGEPEKLPGLQIVTTAGGVNFSFATEKERDEKFNQLWSWFQK